MSGNLGARIGLICFVGGIILLYRLTALPPLHWLILVTGLAFLPALFAKARQRAPIALIFWLIPGAFLAGLTWAAWHSDARIEERLPASLEGEMLEVSGVLCGVPEPGSYGSVRFPFCVTEWHREAQDTMPSRLRLAWYGDDATLQIPPRLRLTVVLKKPHGSLNPRGFRYESWLFRQGYGATGTIREVAEDTSVPCGPVCHYHQWRGSLVDTLLERVETVESGPLIASLMLGYRGALEPEHWQVLKATGTIHLVAISGLHLGLMAFGAAFLIRRLLIWLPEAWLSPGWMRVLTFALVCLASAIYGLAAGFSVPTRRALIMVAVGCWWVFTARKGQAFDGVLVALFLVLIFDPLSPLDQGFWLSFGAVGVLTLVFSGLLGQQPWWPSLIMAQVAIFAALWPILAILDQSQPVVGFFANLVAIPVVSLLIMPAIFVCALCLAVAPQFSDFLINGLDALLTWLWWFLESASELHLPLLSPTLPELVCVAFIVPFALVLPFRAFRLAALATAALWLGAVAHSNSDIPAAGEGETPHPEMWVWDVGQGLSVLVRQQGRTLLYDTGPELEGVYSAAESVLLPNLKELGIQHIDTLVISHADNDHSGGVPLLLEHFSVGRIVSGEPERLTQRLGSDFDGTVEPCPANDQSAGQGYRFWQSEEHVRGNDASCVLTFAFNDGRQTLLLSGDITAEAERAFLSERLRGPGPMAQDDAYRVILAPHHGSKTSSSPEWVAALEPELVVFSAGYRHRYGHPHPEVVGRYETVESRLVNTATSGAIQLLFRPDGVTVTEARRAAPFWIQRPPEMQ